MDENKKAAIMQDTKIYDNGYTWKDMIKISPSEALRRFENNEEVFMLYWENTESLIEEIERIYIGGSYGIEK